MAVRPPQCRETDSAFGRVQRQRGDGRHRPGVPRDLGARERQAPAACPVIVPGGSPSRDAHCTPPRRLALSVSTRSAASTSIRMRLPADSEGMRPDFASFFSHTIGTPRSLAAFRIDSNRGELVLGNMLRRVLPSSFALSPGIFHLIRFDVLSCAFVCFRVLSLGRTLGCLASRFRQGCVERDRPCREGLLDTF